MTVSYSEDTSKPSRTQENLTVTASSSGHEHFLDVIIEIHDLKNEQKVNALNMRKKSNHGLLLCNIPITSCSTLDQQWDALVKDDDVLTDLGSLIYFLMKFHANSIKTPNSGNVSILHLQKQPMVTEIPSVEQM